MGHTHKPTHESTWQRGLLWISQACCDNGAENKAMTSRTDSHDGFLSSDTMGRQCKDLIRGSACRPSRVCPVSDQDVELSQPGFPFCLPGHETVYTRPSPLEICLVGSLKHHFRLPAPHRPLGSEKFPQQPVDLLRLLLLHPVTRVWNQDLFCQTRHGLLQGRPCGICLTLYD